MKIISYKKCNKCGKIIAITEQIETNNGFEYITLNTDCRFIDAWGNARNFCKSCINQLNK